MFKTNVNKQPYPPGGRPAVTRAARRAALKKAERACGSDSTKISRRFV